jgi:hypothetical protein
MYLSQLIPRPHLLGIAMAFDNHTSAEESCASDEEKIAKQPRPKKSPAIQRKRKKDLLTQSTTSESSPLKQKRKTGNAKLKSVAAVTYTIEGVLELWSEATEYGLSFRGMSMEEQKNEVAVLNKGATKGMKGIIKSKLLVTHYNTLVAAKLQLHISESRVTPAAMFHCSPKNIQLVSFNLKFLSVGEWVEVDADRTPGYNSEGGIAVIIGVQDDLADVK